MSQTSCLERCGLVLLTVAVALVLASTAHAGETLTLDGAIRRAWQQSPGIRDAEAEVAAARARVVGARLPSQHNPELSIAVGPRSGPTARTVDYELSITQPIEIAGRRRARIDAATASVKAAEARLAERRGAVVAEVREAFGRALAAEAHEQVAMEAIELATQARNAAERRHQAGAASLIEVNTARIEVGRSQRAHLAARRMRAAAIAELKLLLGMGAVVPLSLQGQLEPSPRERTLDLQALTAVAAGNRADLLVARHELEVARAEQRLASREAVPDPRVGVSFGKEESAQILLGVLSIELPLFHRNQAARGVSHARVWQAELAVAALEQRIAQEVELSVDRVQMARATLEGFSGDVLQALDQNLALVTRGYDAGELDFLELLLMRREMLEARREYIEALAELNSAEAQLDRVLGARSSALGSEPPVATTP
jgi:cobalt-zinc-cadmium efflux system outer membrane protein